MVQLIPLPDNVPGRDGSLALARGVGVRREIYLDCKNPSARDDFEHLPTEQLVESLIEKERRILSIMEEIRALMKAPE